MKTNRTTPSTLAELMTKDIAVGMKVLEPSCGEGTIIKHIISKGGIVTGIELNNNLFKTAQQTYNDCEIIHGDFLNIDLPNDYDRVVAMPPFKMSLDLQHIMKMYSHLKSGGVLISGMSKNVFFDNEEIHINFRSWLEDKDHSVTFVPDFTFIERGMSVATYLIKITKP